MGRNVLVYPCDSFVGSAVAEAFAAGGYSVSGYATGSGEHVPPSVATLVKASDRGSASALRQLLLTADLVVHEILGHETAARDAVVALAQEPYGGKEVVFVGVSHPLVWAATRPKPEALFPSSMVSRDWAAGGAAGTEEGPESWRASDGGVRSTPRGSSGWPGGVQRASGVGDAGAGGSEVGSVPSSPRPGSGRSMGLGLGGGLAVEATTFTSEDVTRRAPAASARAAHAVEQIVLRAARRGRLRTYVVCPGLLYGQGEDDLTFFKAAQAAWSRLPAQVYGHGGNMLPLLHVYDLASYLLALDAAHVAGQTRGLGGRPGTSGGAAPEQVPAAGEAAGGTGLLVRPGTSRAGTGLLVNGGTGTGPLPWGSLPQYLLVCDGSRCTQQEVAAALSTQLGDGSVTNVPEAELHSHPRALRERLLLDLAFDTTPLPAPGSQAPPPPSTSTASTLLRPPTAASPARLGSPRPGVSEPPQLTMPSLADTSSFVPALVPFTPSRPGGLPAHAAAVAEEFRTARRLTPLRILVVGPPMSGKTHLARRLARQYSLPYISVPLLLAAAADPAVAAAAGLGKIDPALHAAAQAELAAGASKEFPGGTGRVSARTLGLMLAAAAADPRVAARGFVLDGFPRSAAQAKAAFFTAVPNPGAEGAAAAEAAPAAHGAHGAHGNAKAPPAPAAKDAKASGHKGSVSSGPAPSAMGDWFEVPAGCGLVPNPLTAPSHVVELGVGELDLRARLAAVEAAEARMAAAARMAAEASGFSEGGDKAKPGGKKPAAGGGGKGGKDRSESDGVPAQLRHSHNNAAGFARRSAAFDTWRTEDAADLEARRAAVQKAWEEEQARQEEERKRQEAEASTLKAKRRRAKMLAAQAAAGAGSPEGGALDELLGDGEGGEEEAGGEAVAAGPVLPEHGGLVGLCVDCGATYIWCSNPNPPPPEGTADAAEDEGALGLMPSVPSATSGLGSEASRGAMARGTGDGHSGGPPNTSLVCTVALPPAHVAAEGSSTAAAMAAAAAAAATPAAQPPPLPVLERAVEAFLGPPHNFDGFPPPVPQQSADSAADEAEEAEAAAAAQRAAEDAAAVDRMAAGAAGAADGGAASQAMRLDGQGAAVQRYLMRRVMPVVAAALAELAAARPPRPLLHVAKALYEAAEAEEGRFVDPYDDPTYGIQLAKIEAKAAREAAREAAAAAKAEREAAARQQQQQQAVAAE